MSAPAKPFLLDLDALMPPAGTEQTAPCDVLTQTIPVYPGENPIPNASTGYHKSNSGKALGDAIPVIPVIPVKNAVSGAEAPDRYSVSPAAVALVFAWCARKNADNKTRGDALHSLDSLPPGEQVAIWSRACEATGIHPWRVWHSESAGSGTECTGCRYFDSFADSLEGTRRRFHWRCALGYPVFELWRWSGLMLIAPPECGSYERYTIPSRFAPPHAAGLARAPELSSRCESVTVGAALNSTGKT